MNNEDLIKEALHARENSYSPYSGFKVGAALLTDDGFVFSGCNIESAAYSPTICAERVALVKAVSEGHKNIQKIAIVGSEQNITYPCGVCRQFLVEFGKKIEVICAKTICEYKIYLLEELLPESFGQEDLKKTKDEEKERVN